VRNDISFESIGQYGSYDILHNAIGQPVVKLAGLDKRDEGSWGVRPHGV
jgi:hypothetical protein